MNMILRFTARPVEPEEAKAFREHTMSLMGEIDALKKDNVRTWKYVALGSLVFGLSGVWAYGHLVPMLVTHVENHWFAVDQVHGFIKESGGPDDAPKMFNEITNEAAVKGYLDDWFTWEWHTDKTRYDRVHLKSSDAQIARYEDWHNKNPLAPRQALGRKGEVAVNAHMIINKEPSDKEDTFQYAFQIRLQTTEGNTVSPWRSWSGILAFKWDPHIVINEDQRRDNPGGMVVLLMPFSEDPT